MNSKHKQYIWIVIVVGLIAISGWYAIEEKKKKTTKTYFTGKPVTEFSVSEKYENSREISKEKANEFTQASDDLSKEKTKNDIEYLLSHIGDRPRESSSGSVFHDIIERSKRENTTPVGELFTNAKKLMDMGGVVIVPLAIHLANLPDYPSDNFTASYRTLRAMLTLDEIRELYNELANKAPSEEEKLRLVRATRLFKD